jgi:hypothetical protein
MVFDGNMLTILDKDGKIFVQVEVRRRGLHSLRLAATRPGLNASSPSRSRVSWASARRAAQA